MAHKADSRQERRITATEASRSFARILDEVERGRRYLIRRRGRDVCALGLPPMTPRRASECIALLRGRRPVLLDERFGEDLLDVLAKEPIGSTGWWTEHGQAARMQRRRYTMGVAELEKRVRALEQEVALLRSRLQGTDVDTRPWWEQIAGSFKGDRAFIEAMRLGREYRESLRPRRRKRSRR